jgi:actin-related protein
VLSCYAFAKENSLVIDIGEFTTECVPVIKGYENKSGMIKVNYGG